MSTFSEGVRKTTTVFLAVFLWLHALFFLDFQSTVVYRATHLLRLTSSEVVVFSLLVVFSFAAGSGFWKAFRSIAYIYFFPFILLWYACYFCFTILRGMTGWFRRQANPQLASGPVEKLGMPNAAPLTTGTSKETETRTARAEFFRFVLRPFGRFTSLWCILLLLSTHIAIVRLCVIVVLIHLIRDIFRIVKGLFFSNAWLTKIGAALRTGLDNSLATIIAGIAVVTPETSPTDELRKLWQQLNIWTKVVNFLKDPNIGRVWAWGIAILFFVAIYVYIAMLFSFVYYGIAKASGVSYPWPDALVNSLFIPFFVSELPRLIWLKLLGGLHCLLVVAVGVGTLVNFIQRRLVSIQTAAMDISLRLADQNIREKFLILETKLTTAPSNRPTPAESQK